MNENVISAFKTHSLWKDLDLDGAREEMSALCEYYLLGKVGKDEYEETRQRLRERIEELKIDLT